MTKIELIKALQESSAPDDSTVWLEDAGGSMGSDLTGWMSSDEECKGVRTLQTDILLTKY